MGVFGAVVIFRRWIRAQLLYKSNCNLLQMEIPLQQVAPLIFYLSRVLSPLALSPRAPSAKRFFKPSSLALPCSSVILPAAIDALTFFSAVRYTARRLRPFVPRPLPAIRSLIALYFASASLRVMSPRLTAPSIRFLMLSQSMSRLNHKDTYRCQRKYGLPTMP